VAVCSDANAQLVAERINSLTMKRFNLITNYYCDKDVNRQNEIDFCLDANVVNSEIERIIVLVTAQDSRVLESVHQSNKITRIITHNRPTYNDFFRATINYANDINAVCNSDIFFDEKTIVKLKDYNWLPDICFALSRWELTERPVDAMNVQGAQPIEAKEMRYSQDSWIFWGMVPFVQGADFCLGMPGCDNSIAYHLKKAGYQLWNPCIDLFTFHYHLSSTRHYSSDIAKNRLPPPYLKVYPCKLEEVGASSPIWLIKRFSRAVEFHVERYPKLLKFIGRLFGR